MPMSAGGVAGYESQGYLASPFDFDYPFQPSPLYPASLTSDLTASDTNYHIGDVSPPSPKRQRISNSQQTTHNSKSNTQMTALATTELAEERGPITAASKPKRNCRKSSRLCKRGVRLNFIDTTVKSPPIIPPTADWKVKFVDESREIASEYKGGLGRYAHLDQTVTPPREAPPQYPVRTMAEDNSLPPIQSSGPYSDNGLSAKNEYSNSRRPSRHHSHTGSESFLTAPPSTSYSNPEPPSPTSESRRYLNSPEEVLFMQVFVEEVGLWMDSMDAKKHFSRILPFHALAEPMLLNAFLACGARHLTLVNPMYHEDKALFYYDTATTQLLRSLQNPDRDTVCCATTAVILNVCEIMSERAMQRMNHIAGARALIKECGWNARSTGIGAACFWLNVGMELLSCLHFNWQVAWEPDQWGVDMNLQPETESGKEEVWVHRMLYIVGKIANFRASIPRFQEPSAHDEQIRLQARFSEWKRLKDLCDSWDLNIPRTMQPMGYLHPDQTSSKSAFPEVWLIKRATIVGRLFYHTAMCLLAQINPLMSKDAQEMNKMQMHHAHLICGIVAHVKDRGVASVALRSLAIAAECLVARREQDEVLEIFEKIRKETGWKVGFIGKELKAKWGWPSEDAQQPPQVSQTSLGQFYPATTQAPATSLPPAPPPPRPAIPSGILNPLLAKADFSLPNHPYQQYYQPPNTQAPNHFPPPPPTSHHQFPPPYA
ncbi:hypothetical protein IFR04_002233 [Cadophora malorum]|uniref:C6 zinc finger domain-containing protein n=1 Tax=Cadophora malorum TaxID=108018 RepID=A0A8H8BUM0_9HELO|nr:hypothetical protein IFR04_002233 [Cadophora malorum]